MHISMQVQAQHKSRTKIILNNQSSPHPHHLFSIFSPSSSEAYPTTPTPPIPNNSPPPLIPTPVIMLFLTLHRHFAFSFCPRGAGPAADVDPGAATGAVREGEEGFLTHLGWVAYTRVSYVPLS
jgi:hypothetical protein